MMSRLGAQWAVCIRPKLSSMYEYGEAIFLTQFPCYAHDMSDGSDKVLENPQTLLLAPPLDILGRLTGVPPKVRSDLVWNLEIFWVPAMRWDSYRRKAERLTDAATSDCRERLLALTTWLDSGGRYFLLVHQYVYEKVTSKTPDCQLEATDFLCLRTGGRLNDDVMNAVSAMMCLLSDNRATCNVLSWACFGGRSMHTRLDRTRRQGAQKIIPALKHDSQWVGFIDIVGPTTGTTGTITIYNSMGASHISSDYANVTTASVLSSLS
jgi:hypothetical protein